MTKMMKASDRVYARRYRAWQRRAENTAEYACAFVAGIGAAWLVINCLFPA